MKKIRSALAPVLSLLVILAGSPIPAQQVVEPVIERPGESLTVRSLKLANTFDSRTEMEFTFENTNSLVDAMLTLEPGLIRLEGFLTLVEVFLPTGQSAPSSGADERIPFEIETRQVHIAIPPSPEEDDDGD